MASAVDIVADQAESDVARLRKQGRRCLTLGLCGAQGSGKSTTAAAVAERLADKGLRVALLSLDDLYLSWDARTALAGAVHPLLQVRGVPGTHDVALGEQVIDDVVSGVSRKLPRFDKAQDTCLSEEVWPVADAPTDVLLFEGWCVGAVPQPAEALAKPINSLELESDPDKVWRHYVNDRLAGAYQRLFSRIDTLVLLAAPTFDVVIDWRQQQERQLRARLAAEGRDASRAMADSDIIGFVQHYERLTRHILAEMPRRARLTLQLDALRNVVDVRRSGGFDV